MKDKISTLLDLLQGTESVEFSVYRGKPDELNGKHRVELHLDCWYKPIFSDSWDECIDKAIEFIKGENKMNYEEKYKEAMSFLKDLRPHMSDYCKEKIDGFFPELRESEDERIRKEIVSFITDARNWFPKEETKSFLECRG